MQYDQKEKQETARKPLLDTACRVLDDWAIPALSCGSCAGFYSYNQSVTRFSGHGTRKLSHCWAARLTLSDRTANEKGTSALVNLASLAMKTVLPLYISTVLLFTAAQVSFSPVTTLLHACADYNHTCSGSRQQQRCSCQQWHTSTASAVWTAHSCWQYQLILQSRLRAHCYSCGSKAAANLCSSSSSALHLRVPASS